MGQRCVVWDIGGVLEITPPTGWVARWEARLGLPPGTVEARLGEVWRAGEVGGIDEREVRRGVARELRLDTGGVDAFLADLWTEYLGRPDAELLGYVRALRERARCRQALLSNSFVGAREREERRYGFAGLVDVVAYSHETGLRKPDPRAYALVCARLGADPADCLFVDDAEPNVAAARAAGLRAVRHESARRTVAAVERHLAAAPPAPPGG